MKRTATTRTIEFTVDEPTYVLLRQIAANENKTLSSFLQALTKKYVSRMYRFYKPSTFRGRAKSA